MVHGHYNVKLGVFVTYVVTKADMTNCDLFIRVFPKLNLNKRT